MKNNEFSDEKLRELLNSSNSAQSFKVPEDYFEGLTENVMSSINSLPDFEKQSVVEPFQVPASYFENLPSVINDRITANSDVKFSIIEWFFNPARTAIAVLSIGLIAGSLFYFTRTETIDLDDNTCSVEEISDSPYLQAISDDDIIDFLATQQEDSTIDEYDQYLLDNDIDISQLEKNL